MTKRQRPPIGDLLKNPPVTNPSAVRADDPVAPAAVEQQAPAPVAPEPVAEHPVIHEAVAEPIPAAAVEPTPKAPEPESAKEPAPVAEVAEVVAATKPEPVQVQAQQVTEVANEAANQAPMLFGAPVHRRSVKQKSSQLSVMVNAELYRIVSGARVEIPGLTGQTILTEGIVMWLIYNNFIDQAKGEEILKAHQQI